MINEDSVMQRSTKSETKARADIQKALDEIEILKNGQSPDGGMSVVLALAKLYKYSSSKQALSLRDSVKSVMSEFSNEDRKKVDEMFKVISKNPALLGVMSDELENQSERNAQRKNNKKNASSNSWDAWDFNEDDLAENKGKTQPTKIEPTKTVSASSKSKWDALRTARLEDPKHQAINLQKILVQHFDFQTEDRLIKFYAQFGDIDKDYNYSFNDKGKEIIALLDENSKKKLTENINEIFTKDDDLRDDNKIVQFLEYHSEFAQSSSPRADKNPVAKKGIDKKESDEKKLDVIEEEPLNTNSPKIGN